MTTLFLPNPPWGVARERQELPDPPPFPVDPAAAQRRAERERLAAEQATRLDPALLARYHATYAPHERAIARQRAIEAEHATLAAQLADDTADRAVDELAAMRRRLDDLAAAVVHVDRQVRQTGQAHGDATDAIRDELLRAARSAGGVVASIQDEIRDLLAQAATIAATIADRRLLASDVEGALNRYQPTEGGA